MKMHRLNAPECPLCGCEDTELVEAGGQRNRSWARFQCNHCGREFLITSGSNAGPRFLERRIPFCPLHNQKMHMNGKPLGAIVYYKCPVAGCGQTAKGTDRIV